MVKNFFFNSLEVPPPPRGFTQTYESKESRYLGGAPNRYVKGVPFFNKRYIKGVAFLLKWDMKG